MRPGRLHRRERKGRSQSALDEGHGDVHRYPRTNCSSKTKTQSGRTNQEKISRLDPSRSRLDLISPGIYRGRQGVSSTREPKTCSDLGLTSTRPCSNDSLGKIPHLEQQSKRFFISKAFRSKTLAVAGLWVDCRHQGLNALETFQWNGSTFLYIGGGS